MTHLQLLIRAAPTPREHLRNIELAARSDAKQHLQIHGGSTPSTDLARIFFYRPPVLLIESIESIRLAYLYLTSTQPLESKCKVYKDLLDFYDSDRSLKRYCHKDIICYTEDTKRKKMKDLSTLKRYTQGFVQIGGWLKAQGRISEEECATYLWQGIPKTLWLQIESWLLTEDPKRLLAMAWTVEEVSGVAESVLQQDWFDWNFIDSDQEERDETDSDVSDNEVDSKDKDLEIPLKKLKETKKLKELAVAQKAKKKVRTKTYPDLDDKDFRAKKTGVVKSNNNPAKSAESKEVEELIQQLNSMSLNDAQYGYLYFKAIKLDKDVEKISSRKQYVHTSSSCTKSEKRRSTTYGSSKPYSSWRIYSMTLVEMFWVRWTWSWHI